MRIRILSAESAGLVGFAKQKYAELRRIFSGGSRITKRMPVGDTLITFELSPTGDTVTLDGAGGEYTVALSGVDGTFLYDYESGRLTKVDTKGGELFQINREQFLQRVDGDTAGYRLLTVSGSRAKALAVAPFEFAAFVPSAEVGVCTFETSLSLQTAPQVFTPAVSFEAQQIPIGVHQIGDTAHVVFSGRDGGWNFVSSPNAWGVNTKDIFYAANPEDAVSPYSWQWVPRIYRVWSGSAIDPSGLHYLAIQKEARQYGDINPEGPYTEVEVAFSCLLDDRSGGAGAEGGVAERLKKTVGTTNGETVTTNRVEVFFTEGMYEPEAAAFYKNDELYTVGYGTALSPPQHLFSIDYENPLGSAPLSEGQVVTPLSPEDAVCVRWWKGSGDVHGVTAYAESGTKPFYVHRFTELDRAVPDYASGETWVRQYGKLLYSGTGFLDASYSLDGLTCSVLYKTEEAQVTTVHLVVIDLAAGVILADNALAGKDLSYGQFILRGPAVEKAEETREPISRDEIPISNAPEERSKEREYSLYGFGHFKDRHRGGHLGGWKLSISASVATAKHWTDVCWGSVYLKHDSYGNPLGSPPSEEYAQLIFRESEVHTNPEELSTTTWHYITGGIIDTSFLTTAEGSITPPEGAEPINTHEFARFGIYFHWEGECIYVSGNTAVPYDITNTHLIYDGQCRVIDPKHCGDMDLKLTDACGEKYVLERGLSELVVGGDASMGVGSSYSAAGGLGPYELTPSCGEMVSGVMTSIEGCCGSESVSGTDSCGQSASVESFANVGQWVQVQFGETPPSTRVLQIVVSGNTRTEFTYVGAGVEYSDEYSDGSGNCYPADSAADTCSGQVATCRNICGWTAGTPGVESLPGSVSLITDNYSANPWCAGYMNLVTGKYITYGAVCWAIDNRYTNVWNWECP